LVFWQTLQVQGEYHNLLAQDPTAEEVKAREVTDVKDAKIVMWWLCPPLQPM